MHLRSLQPLGLYAANPIFLCHYLNTKGPLPQSAYALLRAMGLEVTKSVEGRSS